MSASRRRSWPRSTASARSTRCPRASSLRSGSSAGSATEADTAVLDASALVRALFAGDEEARSWTRAVAHGEVDALAPDLVYAEVGNALAMLVRSSLVEAARAEAILDDVLALSLRVFSVRDLAAAAFRTALATGLSVYDACYLALAEAADAVLVTADRDLAAAASRSVLLG